MVQKKAMQIRSVFIPVFDVLTFETERRFSQANCIIMEGIQPSLCSPTFLKNKKNKKKLSLPLSHYTTESLTIENMSYLSLNESRTARKAVCALLEDMAKYIVLKL